MSRIRGRGLQALTSLLLALALWTYVTFSLNPLRDLPQTIPLVVTNLPPGMTMVETRTGLPTPANTQIQFIATGTRDLITPLSNTDFQAHLDLKGLTPGIHTVPVHLSLPSGIRAKQIQPESIEVRLEVVAQQTVPVVIKQRGQVPFVYTSGTITVGRNTVFANGPTPLLQAVVAAAVSVPLQNLTTDFEGELPVQPIDKEGTVVVGVTLEPARVQVHVPVTPKVQDQQASVVPNLTGTLPPGYSLEQVEWEPKFVKILAAGTLTTTLTTEPISLNGITSSITQTVRLAAIPNIITEPRDVQVQVHLTVSPINIQSQIKLLLPISPVSTTEGLDVSASSSSISVTIGGSIQDLSSLSLNAVRATVVLDKLGPGTYNLPVLLLYPPTLVLVAPKTPVISVTLTRRPSPTSGPAPPASSPSAPPNRPSS